MGKPRLIIIIRHAQSEGNRDKTIHQTTPDHRVSLTPEGHSQAKEAGEKLRKLLRNDDTLHFFISPYRRTRETTEGILSTLCANEPVPSPFQRSRIKVYEEPRLREQDFGNFQPGLEETERLWRERASYGHFFYRIPNGESGADVYDRVSSFNGSLWRRFSEDRMASVAVLVTHGLCSRVFLMAWYHYSVEFFEDLRNINHCEFLVMKLGKNGRYVLQNQLRRWSDLRRESTQRRSISQQHSPEIPVRRWGSSRSHQELAGRTIEDHTGLVRQNTTDLFEDGEDDRKEAKSAKKQSLGEGQHDDQGYQQSSSRAVKKISSNLSSKLREVTLQADLPEPAVPFESRYSFDSTRRGRDGGGTHSGCTSPHSTTDVEDNLEDDTIEEGKDEPVDHLDDRHTPRQSISTGSYKPNSLASALRGDFDPTERRFLADALGDQSDAEVDELDLEMGTKEKELREMDKILADERRERLKDRARY